MHKYWAWLGLNLGKHAGLVAVIGLIVTLGLGFGITKLEFATGQDSYLNKTDTVYKDSVDYQDLFGGQAMITLVTFEGDGTIASLFTPENVAVWTKIEAELNTRPDLILGVVTPLTAMQFNHDLVLPASGDPTQGVAAQILLGAGTRDTEEGNAVRAEYSVATLNRVNAIPERGPRHRQPRLERPPPPRQRRQHPQGAASLLPG